MAAHSNRVELPHSHRDAVYGAKSAGTPNPEERIEVTVYLRRKTDLPTTPDYRVPRERFAQLHGADAKDIETIQAFAHEYGLDIGETNVARCSIVLSGTIEAMSAAFGATLELRQAAGQIFRARTGSLTLPVEVASVVESVLGLDNRPQAKPHFRIHKPALTFKPLKGSPLKTFTGSQVASLYKFPQGMDGGGQCIGLIELGGGYKAKDLDSYFKKIGLNTPKITAVAVDGGHNSPTGDVSGPDGEVVLDIEVAGAAAPGAKIAAYFAPNSDRGFVDAITTAIHDTVNKPSAISISWGSAEDGWTSQARQQMNSAFQAAVAMNVTVLVASGDDGSSDGDTDGAAHVDFPASSPQVTACGGTRLTQTTSAAIADEVVWNDGPGQGATGGGVSQYFARPAYQQNAKVPPSVNDGFIGRGVPDIAGNADPVTGYSIEVDGQSIIVGGTSAVAPLYAALVVRLNQALGKHVGFLNPTLYGPSMARAGFRDIVKGNNGAYAAGPLWDPCTGWGSVIGTALLAALTGKPAGSVVQARATVQGSDQTGQHPLKQDHRGQQSPLFKKPGSPLRSTMSPAAGGSLKKRVPAVSATPLRSQALPPASISRAPQKREPQAGRKHPAQSASMKVRPGQLGSTTAASRRGMMPSVPSSSQRPGPQSAQFGSFNAAKIRNLPQAMPARAPFQSPKRFQIPSSARYAPVAPSPQAVGGHRPQPGTVSKLQRKVTAAGTSIQAQGKPQPRLAKTALKHRNPLPTARQQRTP